MSRDDSVLYSGLVSPARQKTLKQKEEVVKKIDPQAEVILEEITKMKQNLMSIESIATDNTLSDDVKLRQLERMKDRYADLTTLQKRFKKLLGVK